MSKHEQPAEWVRKAETELGTVFALVHKAAYINDKRTPSDIIAEHAPNRRVHEFLDEMGIATNNPRAKLYHRVEKLFEMYQEELAFHVAHVPVDGRPLLFHHPQPLLCANCNDELDGDEDAYCGGCVPPGTFEPAPQSGLSVEEVAERTGRGIALRYGYIGGGEDVGLIKQAIESVAGPLRVEVEQLREDRLGRDCPVKHYENGKLDEQRMRYITVYGYPRIAFVDGLLSEVERLNQQYAEVMDKWREYTHWAEVTMIPRLRAKVAELERFVTAQAETNEGEVARLSALVESHAASNAELISDLRDANEEGECRHSAGVTHKANFCPFCKVRRLTGAIQSVIKQLRCRCEPCYTDRDLHAPDCRAYLAIELGDALAGEEPA